MLNVDSRIKSREIMPLKSTKQNQKQKQETENYP